MWGSECWYSVETKETEEVGNMVWLVFQDGSEGDYVIRCSDNRQRLDVLWRSPWLCFYRRLGTSEWWRIPLTTVVYCFIRYFISLKVCLYVHGTRVCLIWKDNIFQFPLIRIKVTMFLYNTSFCDRLHPSLLLHYSTFY